MRNRGSDFCTRRSHRRVRRRSRDKSSARCRTRISAFNCNYVSGRRRREVSRLRRRCRGLLKERQFNVVAKTVIVALLKSCAYLALTHTRVRDDSACRIRRKHRYGRSEGRQRVRRQPKPMRRCCGARAAATLQSGRRRPVAWRDCVYLRSLDAARRRGRRPGSERCGCRGRRRRNEGGRQGRAWAGCLHKRHDLQRGHCRRARGRRWRELGSHLRKR